MSIDSLTELILQYRYWILIPLSFIEGPLVAFVAGALASLGYFNIYALSVLFLIRDIGLDAICYAVGYFGGGTAFAKRMLEKIGVTPDHLGHVHALWERRPGTTLFIGKLSYGISAAFIVVAGMVKMPLPTFFKYASIVAVLQYGLLLFAGYFLGNSFGGSAAAVIENVQYVVLAAALLITGYYLFTWRMRQRMLKEDKEIADAPTEET
jgi:membrane protein DedA with SNARE-associated domain